DRVHRTGRHARRRDRHGRPRGRRRPGVAAARLRAGQRRAHHPAADRDRRRDRRRRRAPGRGDRRRRRRAMSPAAAGPAAGAADDRPVLTVLQAPDDPRSFPEAERSAHVRYATTDTLSRDIAGADALLLWDYFSGGLQDAWPHADALRWIHIAAAGVDTLLFDGLIASDVVVTNSRGIFDRPIAEFVLGSILAF